MKTLNNLLVLASAAVLVSACASTDKCGSSPCKSKKSDSCYSAGKCAVPENILAAAKAKVPGFKMSCSETDTDNGRKVYQLKGTANGHPCEIKVGADGKVVDVDRD